MSSVIPYIQQALRSVAGDILSTTVQYRRMISNAVADPRSYTRWLAISGVLSGGVERQEYDPDRGRYQTVKGLSFRTADNAVKLNPGDQIMLADKTMYGVISVDSSGPGSIRYGLERIAGSILAGGDRGAPV